MGKQISAARYKELRAININGYTVDLANYLYGLDEYPKLVKKAGEQGDKELMEEIYYQKYCNGTGEYRRGSYLKSKPELKEDGKLSTCVICTNFHNEPVEASNRFSLKKLQEIAASTANKEEETK